MNAADVQRTLRSIGLRPQQAAGQNFLLDESVAVSMVTAAGVTEDDTILEIGPGLGILTEALLETGARVIAVELDQRLFSYLHSRWRKQERVTLVRGDIFRVDLNEWLNDSKYKLVANLPYSGTSLVFRNFLSLPPRPTSMTVMVQRDVAERITATPGAMSLLSLTVQYYTHPELLFTVPPKSFTPVPRVQSAVLHCEPVRPLDNEADQRLFRLMRAGFSSRRKQLHNCLMASFRLSKGSAQSMLQKIGLKPTVRAQELSLKDWLTLAEKIG